MAIYVMTWNIKAGQKPNGSYPTPKTANLDKIAETIKNSGALVVSLQEVDAYTERSGSNVHQSLYIADKLSQLMGTKWYHLYITAKEMTPGYYGNAIISRYPITAAIRLRMAKVKDKEDRSFMLACVDFGTTSLYVGTFHLGFADKYDQAQKIKDEIYAKGFSNKRLVIGGDLNEIPDKEAFNIMSYNTFRLYDTDPNDIPTFPSTGEKMDYWFTNNLKYVNNNLTKVLNTDISDHRPLMTYVYTG